MLVIIYILISRISSSKQDGVVVDVVDCKQIAFSVQLADDIWHYERTKYICEMSLRIAVRRLFAVI